MLTKSILRRMWPRAPQAKIDGVMAVAPTLLAKWGINNDLRLAHFMAQISHENGAGTITRENLNYRSADQLLKIFGAKEYSVPRGGKGHSAALTPAQAEALIGKPRELAERVYGLGNPKKAKELGNTKEGDAYACRGGGDLQLTGAGNYRKIGALIGMDLYGHPELFDDPKTSFEVSVIEFVKLGCLPLADQDDCELVTRKVNGGVNGLAERKVWLRKWKAALAADDIVLAPSHISGDVPPPEEPRGGEADKTPSNTAVVATRAGAGVLGGITAAAQVAATVTGPVVETVEQVRQVTDSAGAIVETSKQVVRVAPEGFWMHVLATMRSPGFLACVIILICAAWAVSWWLRRRKGA
jgi:putative chitinase